MGAKRIVAKKDDSLKKDNKKRKIILIGLIILIIGSIVGIGISMMNKPIEDEKKIDDEQISNIDKNLIYNTNEDVVSDKVVGDISITNIECYFDGNISLLDYTITNNGKENIKLNEYELIVKDSDGNILAIMAPTIDYELKPDEAYDTGSAIDIDLSDVSTIEVNLNP
ncbi:MAG: hypothetical protein IJ509_02435 [Bacilli bacterium]|nr:hypothetical protein [Bacilli bacterium]